MNTTAGKTYKGYGREEGRKVWGSGGGEEEEGERERGEEEDGGVIPICASTPVRIYRHTKPKLQTQHLPLNPESMPQIPIMPR